MIFRKISLIRVRWPSPFDFNQASTLGSRRTLTGTFGRMSRRRTILGQLQCHSFSGGADPQVRGRPPGRLFDGGKRLILLGKSGTRASRGPEGTPQGVRPTNYAESHDWKNEWHYALACPDVEAFQPTASSRLTGGRQAKACPTPKGTILIGVISRLLLAVCLMANVCFAARPVIFDTDMGNDIDDALALAMLHALSDRGEC